MDGLTTGCRRVSLFPSFLDSDVREARISNGGVGSIVGRSLRFSEFSRRMIS
jgi:hypothetical protein